MFAGPPGAIVAPAILALAEVSVLIAAVVASREAVLILPAPRIDPEGLTVMELTVRFVKSADVLRFPSVEIAYVTAVLISSFV